MHAGGRRFEPDWLHTLGFKMQIVGFVSGTCEGESCKCGRSSTHKVEEVISFDDPVQDRHPLTRYLCCFCFRDIMGKCDHKLLG